MTVVDFPFVEGEGGTLQDLLDATVAAATPSFQTGTARKAQIANALDTADLDELIALQEKLEKLLDRILENKINPEDTTLLSSEELMSLMIEALDQADVKRLLEVRYQVLRARIFGHITEDNRSRGIPDPDHAPGQAEVPALRRKFTREGGKRRATLDHDKLRQELGEERSADLFRSEIVQEVHSYLDENALMTMVRDDPAVMEIVRRCVVPGPYASPRFHIRPMESGQVQEL